MRWPFCSKYFRKDARMSFEVILSIVFPERRQHAIRLEPLSGQVSIEPAELRRIGNAFAAPQSLGERRGDQGLGIEGLEDLVGDSLGNGGRNAGLLDVPANPQLAAA